ncbi:hypothetical protein Lesp02_20530 [Lentzea sp. NBRC 105346]|uniref:DUF3558 family protein n=1 Tax=Lentzea sp. NBRC 105346 TaxID=3032205 RepID=UPI0024A5BB7D|nr:DUF3558 family protein [Lentzea sp. NBRC 105346]GLZ29863.1 hypothetical protein Lesp02_20530 [Lentzea sp. NBRC 105346]
MISRLLPLLLLAACTATPPVASTPATTSATPATTTARIDTPRNVKDIDACKLLTAEDVRSVGPFYREPADNPDGQPPAFKSCRYAVDDGSEELVTVYVQVIPRKYKDVVFGEPKGSEEIVDGHSVWSSCEPNDRELWCMSTAAVTEKNVLRVSVRQPKASAQRVQQLAKEWLPKTLRRLPVT